MAFCLKTAPHMEEESTVDSTVIITSLGCGGATSTTGRAGAGNLTGSTSNEDQDEGTMNSSISSKSH